MVVTLQTDPLQIRADALMEVFANSLPSDRYLLDKPDASEGLYFAIAEKNYGGKHWGRRRGITLYEYRMMIGSSTTDQEALQRMRGYFLEGKDTIRPPQQEQPLSIPIDQVQQMVRNAVEQALAQQRHLSPPASAEANLAPQPARPRKRQSADARLLEDWTAKAAELGIDPPKMSPKNKDRIDGRWLRHATEKWNAHIVERSQQRAEAATAGAP